MSNVCFSIFLYFNLLNEFEYRSDGVHRKIIQIKKLREFSKNGESVLGLKIAKEFVESLESDGFIEEGRLTDIGEILKEDFNECLNVEIDTLKAKYFLLKHS